MFSSWPNFELKKERKSLFSLSTAWRPSTPWACCQQLCCSRWGPAACLRSWGRNSSHPRFRLSRQAPCSSSTPCIFLDWTCLPLCSLLGIPLLRSQGAREIPPAQRAPPCCLGYFSDGGRGEWVDTRHLHFLSCLKLVTFYFELQTFCTSFTAFSQLSIG